MNAPRAKFTESHRDVALEALRGMAALIVMAWHFCLAFSPAFLGDPSYGFHGKPWFAFVHGSAAVGVFFVLSGYVLTRRYFITGQKRLLVAGALKRWFRLALPVFLSVMLSWFLFHFDLYRYQEAANISHSDWLYTFCLGMNPPFEPSFSAAVENGFAELFHHADNSFNPLLWTLHIELLGSYVVFAMAGLILALRNHIGLILLMTLLAVPAIHFIEPFMIPFLPGVLLAFFTPQLQGMRRRTAFALIVLGLIFLGYREPGGFYGFLDFLTAINGEALRAYVCTIGATLIMMAFVGCEPLRQRLQGPVARALGRLSFPLYLVHLVLICSLGSAVFVWAQRIYSYNISVTITALVWLPAVFALAAILAVIDVKWIAFVNRLFRSVTVAEGV